MSHLVSPSYLLLVEPKLTENYAGGLAAAASCIKQAYPQGPVWYTKIPMEVVGKSRRESLVYGVNIKYVDIVPIIATKSIYIREGAKQLEEKNATSQVCQLASLSPTTVQVHSDDGGRWRLCVGQQCGFPSPIDLATALVNMPTVIIRE